MFERVQHQHRDGLLAAGEVHDALVEPVQIGEVQNLGGKAAFAHLDHGVGVEVGADVGEPRLGQRLCHRCVSATEVDHRTGLAGEAGDQLHDVAVAGTPGEAELIGARGFHVQ